MGAWMSGRRPLVHRFVCRRLAEIPEAQRGPLFDWLHMCLDQTYAGLSRETFERVYMRPGAELGIGYGRDGRFAGFIVVNRFEPEIGGRRYTIFTSLVAISLEFKGGARAMAFAMKMALRYKLRYPWRSVAYVAIASTPAAYRVNVQLAPRVYPSASAPTPTRVQDLIAVMTQALGLLTLRAEPRIIECRMRPRDRDRLARSRVLEGDPAVAYYEAIAPRWAEGESPMLCVLLDLPDIARSFVRLGRRQLARARSRLRSRLRSRSRSRSAPQLEA